jgi:cephalosporin hydroxylase
MIDRWNYTQRMRDACVAAFGDWHSADLWKHNDDLRRYEKIIKDTRPDVIIECGTNTGASASWMASARYVHPDEIHPLVITVDVDGSRWNRASQPENVIRVVGDSASLAVLERVKRTIMTGFEDWAEANIMVSLDSDHSAGHVRREIELYAPLVTPGCYLVVEDGIFSWLRDDQWRAHGCMRADGTKIYDGTPLDAIEDWGRSAQWADRMPGNFERDMELELAYPVTMNPAGWWRRA